MTAENYEASLLAAGFTKRDLRRRRMLAEVHELGPEVWEVFEREMQASQHFERATEQLARACLTLFGGMDDPAALAREMLKGS